jgi:hypothetical protein
MGPHRGQAPATTEIRGRSRWLRVDYGLKGEAIRWDVYSLRFVVDMLQDAGGELIKKTPLADLVKLKQLLINNTGP